MPKKGQIKPDSEMQARYHKMRVNGKQINVARYVLEQKLGRPLHYFEYVHHINGNKLDDRPENLELVTPKSHATIHLAGKVGCRKGAHHTKESILKMSIAHKGHITSPNQKVKTSLSMKLARQKRFWSSRKQDK